MFVKKFRLVLCGSENIFPDFISSSSIYRITASFSNLSFAAGDNYFQCICFSDCCPFVLISVLAYFYFLHFPVLLIPVRYYPLGLAMSVSCDPLLSNLITCTYKSINAFLFVINPPINCLCQL